MTDPNAYVDLIGKFLAGEITPGEKTELSAWAEQSPANRKFFEEMEALWRMAAQHDPQPELDARGAWERLEGALAQDPRHTAYSAHVPQAHNPAISTPQSASLRSKSSPHTVRLMPIFLRIAAVLIPAVIALWWWQGKRESAAAPVTAQTAYGERREVQLPDGSVVQLNQLSELSFRENDTARLVILSGEAFFEVKHQAGKPFVIQSGEARTTVLGTSFNVRAYPGEDQVEVSVATGKVQVEAVPAPEQKAVIQAGQAVIVQKESRRITAAGDLAANAAAWKNRRLSFQDTRVSDVAGALERYFNVSIQLEDPDIGACRFSGDYNDPELEDILRALTFAMDLQLAAKDSVFILQGDGCPR